MTRPAYVPPTPKKSQSPDQKVGMIDRMNQLFTEAITTRPFPMEAVSSSWFLTAVKALYLTSPRDMNLTHEQHVELLKVAMNGREYVSLFNFANLTNNLELRTPQQLELTLEEYSAIITEGGQHVKTHMAIINDLRKECETAAASEFQKPAQEAARTGGLNAITGEA